MFDRYAVGVREKPFVYTLLPIHIITKRGKCKTRRKGTFEGCPGLDIDRPVLYMGTKKYNLVAEGTKEDINFDHT